MPDGWHLGPPSHLGGESGSRHQLDSGGSGSTSAFIFAGGYLTNGTASRKLQPLIFCWKHVTFVCSAPFLLFALSVGLLVRKFPRPTVLRRGVPLLRIY